MTARLLRFEIYRAAYPTAALGEYLETIEAADHRAAKALAAERHPGQSVVVMPAGRNQTKRDRRAHSGLARTPRSSTPRPRP